MAPFKLSLDAKLLLVPISAAGMLLVGMVSRIPTRDPEASRSGMAAYDDEMKAAAVGSRYENEIKGLFDMRIKARAFGIFDNDVKAQ